jgi:phosphate transport system substrate-binding protein
MMKKILAAVMLAGTITVANAQVTGAGATFPYPVYAKWAAEYKKQKNIEINYQSIGSGAGIKQIQARTVTFGASDMPLTKEQLDRDGLVQVPTVIGGNVIAVNLDGVKSGDMVLDGTTVADIYLGKIRSWDDSRISKLNPTLKLPKLPITVVRRSDGSGTTFIFTNYLSKVSPEWRSKIGEGTAIEWPLGVGAKGNEGVAGNVSQTRGSIGYVEYAYAKQAGLTYTSLINAVGKTVQPGISSFAASAKGNAFDPSDGYYTILTNIENTEAWPIAGATFVLMPQKPTKPEDSKAAIEFFIWAYEQGDKMAEDLAYVPLPDDLVNKIKETLKEVN